MNVVAAILAGIAGLNIFIAYLTKQENEDLRNYVEFYRRQLNSALSGWEECADRLTEESERHGECATKFQELLRAYETAYDILDRHGLLPEELE